MGSVLEVGKPVSAGQFINLVVDQNDDATSAKRRTPLKLPPNCVDGKCRGALQYCFWRAYCVNVTNVHATRGLAHVLTFVSGSKALAGAQKVRAHALENTVVLTLAYEFT